MCCLGECALITQELCRRQLSAALALALPSCVRQKPDTACGTKSWPSEPCAAEQGGPSAHCRAMPCSAAPCSAVPCRAVPCRAALYHAVPCSAVPCHAVQRSSAVQGSTVQCNAVHRQCSAAVQSRAVQCCAVQCRAGVRACAHRGVRPKANGVRRQRIDLELLEMRWPLGRLHAAVLLDQAVAQRARGAWGRFTSCHSRRCSYGPLTCNSTCSYCCCSACRLHRVCHCSWSLPSWNNLRNRLLLQLPPYLLLLRHWGTPGEVVPDAAAACPATRAPAEGNTRRLGFCTRRTLHKRLGIHTRWTFPWTSAKQRPAGGAAPGLIPYVCVHAYLCTRVCVRAHVCMRAYVCSCVTMKVAMMKNTALWKVRRAVERVAHEAGMNRRGCKGM